MFSFFVTGTRYPGFLAGKHTICCICVCIYIYFLSKYVYRYRHMSGLVGGLNTLAHTHIHSQYTDGVICLENRPCYVVRRTTTATSSHATREFIMIELITLQTIMSFEFISLPFWYSNNDHYFRCVSATSWRGVVCGVFL